MLAEYISSITLRTIYALISSFFIVILLGPWVIRKLREKKIGQNIREEGVKAHLEKSGVPTMGGVMIIVAVTVATILWSKLEAPILIVLATFLWMGLLGFLDDFLKLIRGKSLGLKASQKFLGQNLFVIGLGVFLYHDPAYSEKLFVPGFNLHFELGALYILLVFLTVTGSSNAVNLTDGLDGLAAGVTLIVMACMGFLAYLGGNVIYAKHLNIPYMAGSGELTVFCLATVGACLGFLWYNAKPAEVFMGDTGSLALGGSLGAVAILCKQELILVIVGGIFVVEALSVMLQVTSYRYRGGKRIFKMAPIHHHFELCGWPETKVVIRFWIVTLILALLGMSILGINGRIF